jgi:methyl-accepting chemotaxis protein
MKVRAIWVLLALITAAAAWLGIRSAGQTQTIARLEAELRAARAAPSPAPAPPVGELRPAQPGSSAAPHTHPSAKRLELPTPDTAEPFRQQVQQLTTELTAAQAHGAELRLKIDELAAERDRLAASEADARRQIAELREASEVARIQHEGVEKNLKALDTEVQTLRQQSRTASQRSEDLAKTAAELQDVLRRQQTYVNNVVSRYREITDILRQPAAPAGSRDLGPDLVRAGSLISMTDEDLRAVRDLNARLALIQKRLLAAAGQKTTP